MAAKTIKGITVEIGGNTTGLGKALKDVESTANGLANNLKNVNKALDLDPSNVVLVAEKQKILASYVDATREKLETLEAVQEQIAAQYASGEIGQSAYLDFQKELVYTRTKLEDLEKQQKKFGDTVEAVANGELENFNDTLRETDDAAEEAGDGFTVAKGAVADFVSDAVQSAIGWIQDLIGELFNLADATEEFQTMQSKLAGSADTFGYSMEFASGAYQNFYRYLSDDQAATNAITNLMGLRTSTESLTNLANASIAVWTAYGDSIPIEPLTESINETAQVAKVTGVLADALNWAGISEDAFNEKLATTSSTQERANLIAATLNDTYAVSKTRYDQLNGSILANNEAEQRLAATEAQLGEAMRPVNTELTELKNELLVMLLPLITELAQGFADLLGWLREHPTVLQILTGAVIGLAGAFLLLAAAMAIQGIVSMLSGGFMGLAGSMGALPIVAVLGGIAALTAGLVYLLTHTEELSIALDEVKNKWEDTEARATEIQESRVAREEAAKDAEISFWEERFARESEIQDLMLAREEAAKDAEISLWEERGARTSEIQDLMLAREEEARNAQSALWNSFFSDVLSGFASFGSTLLESASTVWSTYVADQSEIATATHDSLSAQSASVSDFWSSTKAEYQAGQAALVTGTHNSLNAQVAAFTSFKQNVLSTVNSWGTSLKSTVMSALESAKASISSGLERIKSLFRFEWSLPHIKLPHFYVSGSFSLNPPSVPHFGVQWYAKGAILNGAQLFGMLGGNLLGGGEAGPEAVLPLSGFYDNLNSILTSFLRANVPSIGNSGELLSRLDRIYDRLDRLQVILDSGTLVGEILDYIDEGLGIKQRLAERGV